MNSIRKHFSYLHLFLELTKRPHFSRQLCVCMLKKISMFIPSYYKYNALTYWIESHVRAYYICPTVTSYTGANLRVCCRTKRVGLLSTKIQKTDDDLKDKVRQGMRNGASFGREWLVLRSIELLTSKIFYITLASYSNSTMAYHLYIYSIFNIFYEQSTRIELCFCPLLSIFSLTFFFISYPNTSNSMFYVLIIGMRMETTT